MAYQILMIDDDREMVTLGKLILEREGFEFISAHSGKEGLEILDKDSDNIDLILLDIMMVGIDGWQVLEAIKDNEQYSHLPVIMLTAKHYLENESEAQYYADKFDGYVVKPFVVRDLMTIINGLLGDEST